VANPNLGSLLLLSLTVVVVLCSYHFKLILPELSVRVSLVTKTKFPPEYDPYLSLLTTIVVAIISKIMVFDGDKGPHIQHPAPSDPPLLVLTSLGITLLVLGRLWTPLHSSIPLLVHLPCRQRLSFEGKGQVKDIKQELLGRQPEHFITLKKRKKKRCFSTSSLSPIACLSPTLGLFICPFH